MSGNPRVLDLSHVSQTSRPRQWLGTLLTKAVGGHGRRDRIIKSSNRFKAWLTSQFPTTQLANTTFPTLTQRPGAVTCCVMGEGKQVVFVHRGAGILNCFPTTPRVARHGLTGGACARCPPMPCPSLRSAVCWQRRHDALRGCAGDAVTPPRRALVGHVPKSHILQL